MEGRKKNSYFPFFKASALAGISLAMMVGSAQLSFAAGDDLPTPSNGLEEEIPSAPPQDSSSDSLPDFLPDSGSSAPSADTNSNLDTGGGVGTMGESDLPSPSDSLPEPSANRGSNGNIVNKAQPSDDIFLPTPGVQDNVNYAPVSSSAGLRYDDASSNDWRASLRDRPAFTLGLGAAVRRYEDARTTNTPGMMISGSWRVINIAQTIFLHAYAAGSLYRIGDIGPYSGVMDVTTHFGGLLEIGVGRRLSLFGSAMRRSNTISTNTPPVTANPNQLSLIDEPAKLTLGLGAQWDFYVVPHGSLGARVQIEQNLAMFMLTMAIEPAPRKHLSLNYDPLER